MVSLEKADSAIEKLLLDEPSAIYPPRVEPRVSPDPIITVVSQPVPDFGLKTDCSNIRIKLSDFGHCEIATPLISVALRILLNITSSILATWVDQHHTEDIQSIGLRAPEVVLRHKWSTPVDI